MRLVNAIVPLGLAVLPALRGASAWNTEIPLPRAVAGQAAALHHDTLVVAGGSFWSGEVKRIDDTVRRRTMPGSGSWETLAQLPGGFAHGGWASDGAHLWLIGGLDERGPSRAVRRIVLATGVVETLPSLPEPRVYGGAAILDGALWVAGGTPDENDFSRTSATIWKIDLATHAINALAAPGPKFINPLVLALRGELHVLPGGVWSADKKLLEAPTQAWIFSPRTERWTRRTLSAALPRGLSGATLDDHRALLAGGVERRDNHSSLSSGAWLYDAATGALAPHTALPAPRLAAAIISGEKNDVWLLGGEDAPRSRVATVWRWREKTGGGQ